MENWTTLYAVESVFTSYLHVNLKHLWRANMP